jgi:hypothetical protein
MWFFGACAAFDGFAMTYGIVHPDLVLAIIGAGTLPLSLWLVKRTLGIMRRGGGAIAAGSDTPRRTAVSRWLLPSVVLVLFIINFVAASAPHPSRALVAAFELAALAAGTAYIWHGPRGFPPD